MNRITLNIDLDENKDLEQEVTGAIQAYAKKVAREQVEKMIREEVGRIIEARVTQYSDSYSFERQIREAVRVQFDDALKKWSKGIEEAIEARLSTWLKSVMDQMNARIEKSMSNFLSKQSADPDALVRFVCGSFKESLLSDKK